MLKVHVPKKPITVSLQFAFAIGAKFSFPVLVLISSVFFL